MSTRFFSLTLVCMLLTGVIACAKVETQQPAEADKLPGIVAQASAATVGAAVLSSVPTLKKSISLVFFGAPDKDATEQLLALLKKRNVRATFFLPGILVAEQPGIAQEIFAAGHELGNYVLSGGEDLSELSMEDAARKLYHAQTILSEASNQAPVLFATGGTTYTESVLATAKACGLPYALRPTAYLNHMSFSSPDQARTFASFTDYGSILAFKVGQLTEDELYAHQDEEVLEAAEDPAPSAPSSPSIELPEDADARMLLILDWLLGAYNEDGYAFLQPEDLQKEAEADLNRTFALSDAPAAVPASVIKNAATTQKAVSLTFQSLCGDEEVKSLLHTLAALNIKATFFVTGEDAATRKTLIQSIASSFCMRCRMSSPLRPRPRFKASALSAMCRSSCSTKPGTTSFPSITPVWQISNIRPSIMTEVSSILGRAIMLVRSRLPEDLIQSGSESSLLRRIVMLTPR